MEQLFKLRMQYHELTMRQMVEETHRVLLNMRHAYGAGNAINCSCQIWTKEE
jgi:hypothetical protein